MLAGLPSGLLKGVVKLTLSLDAEKASLVPPLPEEVLSPVSFQSMPLKLAVVWKE